MQHIELNEVKKENIEAKIVMYKEIIVIYLKCLLFFPNVPELRPKLFALMKGFFVNLKNEAEIIKVLDNAILSQEDFDEILLKLDDFFDQAWDYYESIIDDYESAMFWRNWDRVLLQKERTKPIDEEKKQEMLQLIMAYEQKQKTMESYNF